MTTFSATNTATQNSSLVTFILDFDKKKLTEKVLHCETTHQRLQSWINDSILEARFKEECKYLAPQAIYDLTWTDDKSDEKSQEQKRLKAIRDALNHPSYFRETVFIETLLKGMRKNNNAARPLMLAGLAPIETESLNFVLNGFMSWCQCLSSQRFSPLYQTLVTVYYLTIIQPLGTIQTAFNFVLLHQELQKMGFGIVADYILSFYAQHENILADTLASCYHARNKKFHQQHWFQLFFEAWDWALKKTEQMVQSYSLNACYIAYAQELFEKNNLNERQYQLVMQLRQEKDPQDRKSLHRCLWYKTLYRDLTKRTQERDFALIQQYGFI